MQGKNRPHNYTELCIATLKEKNFRITKTRKAAADAVAKVTPPFSVKDLHEYIESSSKIKMDFATVFRIVQTFKDLGLIHPSSSPGNYLPCLHLACGDFVHVIHTCTSCATVCESHLSDDLGAKLKEELLKNQFESNTATLQVTGSCQKCR